MMPEDLKQNEQIFKNIEKQKIFGVIRTQNTKEAIGISKALIEGGIKVIEITMGINNASSVIQEISSIEGVTVAAGSVITSQQAEAAIDAGAKYIVSPITEMRLIKLCKGRKVPIITGAATPNEAYSAWKQGVNIIKIFPVKALGGPEYIKDILTPMPFLKLMPTGGVFLNDFMEYLKVGAVSVGIGNAFYEDKNYSIITKKAQKATQKIKEYESTIN